MRIANALKTAIETAGPHPNYTLCQPPLDKLQKQGLFFTLHDNFLTVSCEGDSDTFDTSDADNAVQQAVESAVALLTV